MFQPLRTERLLIRPAGPDDADALADRRSDPAVAEYQSWAAPFSLEQARQLLEETGDHSGPQSNSWWMATVTNPADDTILGDLAVHLSSEARTAEIGYTFSSRFWGRGYAVEAVEALVEWLFKSHGVTRIQATVHPDNVASALVAERNGFIFEGRTRLSHLVGDENSDDVIYGMIRPDWDAWQQRPTMTPEVVELVELTADNHRQALALATHHSQEALVAPMGVSLANMAFPAVVNGHPIVPWARGVVGDGEWVGFVLMTARTEHHPEPYLWRFLIDRLHQRRGIGRRVLDQVIEQVRSEGATSLRVHWGESRGSPRPFYEGFGFKPTGRISDGEVEARLDLRSMTPGSSEPVS